MLIKVSLRGTSPKITVRAKNMKKITVLIIFFMNVAIAYAQTVDNSTSVTVHTMSDGTTRKTTYISGFKDDYSKPKNQDNQNQTANITDQNADNYTSQNANQSNTQSSEEIAAPAKVLISK